MRRRWLWWGAWKGGCRTIFEEKEKGRREGGKKVEADSATAATGKCQWQGGRRGMNGKGRGILPPLWIGPARHPSAAGPCDSAAPALRLALCISPCLGFVRGCVKGRAAAYLGGARGGGN